MWGVGQFGGGSLGGGMRKIIEVVFDEDKVYSNCSSP